jgi:RNA polymerase sigma-70 factor (ECF subfamily)
MEISQKIETTGIKHSRCVSFSLAEVNMGSEMRPVSIEELIERYHALLYRFAYRLSGSPADAEDLTQQTYLIAHQSLNQLRDPAKAKSWLCTILRHAFLRMEQQRILVQRFALEHDPEQPEIEATCDEEAVQAALNKLPEEYRSAAILFYFQELSYKEIAEALETPIGTVMSRLSRAKQQLRRLLEPHELADPRDKLISKNPRPPATSSRTPAFVE